MCTAVWGCSSLDRPSSGDAAADAWTSGGVAEPTPPGPAGGRRDRAAELVLTSLSFVDAPYRRGGASAQAGFDCSGFTRHVFERSLGIVLPRSADEQAGAGGLRPVRRAELLPGDLVFFNTLGRTFSHVGIYVGDGRFVHAPRPGARVRVEDLRTAYWARRYTGARRAASIDAPAAPPAYP